MLLVLIIVAVLLCVDEVPCQGCYVVRMLHSGSCDTQDWATLRGESPTLKSIALRNCKMFGFFFKKGEKTSHYIEAEYCSQIYRAFLKPTLPTRHLPPVVACIQGIISCDWIPDQAISQDRASMQQLTEHSTVVLVDDGGTIQPGLLSLSSLIYSLALSMKALY
ncbi:hypothetical protein LIA77_08649 [Sarocladium implicatum]|nr:hypothetical protein LIA77_08649 [Sarocladium implicatum]